MNEIKLPKTTCQDLVDYQDEYAKRVDNINYRGLYISIVLTTILWIIAVIFGLFFLHSLCNATETIFRILFGMSMMFFIGFGMYESWNIVTYTNYIYNFNRDNDVVSLDSRQQAYVEYDNRLCNILKRRTEQFDILKTIPEGMKVEYKFKGWDSQKADSMLSVEIDIIVNGYVFDTLYIPTLKSDYFRAIENDFTYFDEYVEGFKIKAEKDLEEYIEQIEGKKKNEERK